MVFKTVLKRATKAVGLECGFRLHWFVCSLTTGRLTYILNEVADNSIVEIFNVGPLDVL